MMRWDLRAYLLAKSVQKCLDEMSANMRAHSSFSEMAERARATIWQYESDNSDPRIQIPHEDALPQFVEISVDKYERVMVCWPGDDAYFVGRTEGSSAGERRRGALEMARKIIDSGDAPFPVGIPLAPAWDRKHENWKLTAKSVSQILEEAKRKQQEWVCQVCDKKFLSGPPLSSSMPQRREAARSDKWPICLDCTIKKNKGSYTP